MHKLRTQAIIFSLTIIFIIVLVAIILYPFDFSGKDINQIYAENSGLIWLLTSVIGIIIVIFQYFNFQIVSVLKKLSKDNEEKNKIIIDNQKDSFAQFEELTGSITDMDKFYVEKWSGVTDDIIIINKRLDGHNDRIAKLEG